MPLEPSQSGQPPSPPPDADRPDPGGQGDPQAQSSAPSGAPAGENWLATETGRTPEASTQDGDDRGTQAAADGQPAQNDSREVPAQEPPASPGPAGSGDYEVQQGECINSIAAATGHFWQTIWNDPGNADLRRVRTNPDILLPGDRLVIPPIRPKQESGATEARHTFRRRGEPCRLRLRILREDEQPWADAPYRLIIDEQTILEGTTDSDGRIDVGISGRARSGRLLVGAPGDPRGQEEYPLALGSMDPPSEISGIQARLNNLGFDCGQPDGRLDSELESALRSFQGRHGLDPTGRLDDATRSRLLELHGS